MDYIPMSRAGYEKRKAELDHLENVELPEITQRVAEARAEGDLKENAEYHGQRQQQGLVQAKINDLRDRLSRARIIEAKDLPTDEVVFGTTVVVYDLDLEEEETFTLVGEGDEQPDEGKILVTSPMAQGLLGKKVGERAEIEVPAGVMTFEIKEIRPPQ